VSDSTRLMINNWLNDRMAGMWTTMRNPGVT